MDPVDEQRLVVMKKLDESFREVRKQILAEWNRTNKHGLGMSHGRMLIILHESGPQKSTALAEGLTITNGGVTGIADRLIELGYVKRERSSQDRRTVMLMLTVEGQAMVESMLKVRENVMLKLFDGLSMEEMERGLQLFRKLSANMVKNS
ncbi:MarR family winged helix-turn-helix transcriptional regulator [Paenibacillus sp. GSMTC-2017]|uniref:MarR family winged helix-turn-helix transcriptional regulator n=1 Tax=Paenibacillus sp. GSMTC-2017 TaxID=2794350 RepID=UPI0018D66F26|nr:MarR family transcriptional regulator [Paenibacillus sp. GSMTC-2017]